jgi:hypothetical protein
MGYGLKGRGSAEGTPVGSAGGRLGFDVVSVGVLGLGGLPLLCFGRLI